MVEHLIAYSRYQGIAFAYHFATTDLTGEQITQHLAQLAHHPRLAGHHYGVHVLSTESASFASVQALDPYFADCREFTSLDDFFQFFQTVNGLHVNLG